MQGQTKVINALNQALGISLVTINQYFLHARMLKNWGIFSLGNQEYGYSLQSMKDADRLIERILFLEHKPNVSDLGYLRIGENPPEILESGRIQAMAAAECLRRGISISEQNQDFVSRKSLDDILKSVESQIHWHETRLALLSSMGLENFLQSQID